MTDANVLLLGGTGAIGFYLIPELLAAGFRVFVTTRSVRESDHPRLQYVAADAMDSAATSAVLSEVEPDAVVDFMSYGTSVFVDRCNQILDGTRHYCFLSSYRVFADSSPTPLTERSPRLLDVCGDRDYLATDEYALAKAREEDALRASCRRNWTIVRPSITYSRNRFQLGTLEANTVCYRALHGLPVLMASEILAKQTTMTWAGDVAKMILRLLLNEAALGQDYNVVTAEHQTWAEVAACYAKCIGLRVIETGLDQYTCVVGGEYQIKYDRMFDRIMDNSKVLAATGMKQSDLRPLGVGLETELREFQRSPYFQYPNIAANARMDRATGTHMPLAGQPIQTRIRYFVEKHPALKRKCSLLRNALRGWH